MKVQDLLDILTQLDGETEVRASWESITPNIAGVYIGNKASGAEGAILLDSDGNFYLGKYAAKILWQDEDYS